MNKSVKIVLLIAAASLLLAGLALIPAQLGQFGQTDFFSYWASAHLLVEGQNPYDYEAIVALMAKVMPDRQEVLPAWNPPWLTVFLIPLAVLPFDAAARIWLVFNLIAVSGLALVVWQRMSTSKPPLWLPFVALGFYATLVMISIGQIVVVVLLGIIACVAALRAGQDGWAGAALVLTLGKPQLVYVAVPLILIWSARQRRWRVWLGLGAAWSMALLAATLLSPDWLSGYVRAVSQHDFFMHLSATLGGAVKAYTGSDVLRFAGVIGLLLIPWLLRVIERHDLLTGLNVALLISVPLAPYGWTFDQIVLLPAIVQLATWLTTLERSQQRWYGLILIAIYAVALGLKLAELGDFVFVWVPIALGCLYALVYRTRFERAKAAQLAVPLA